MPLRYTASTANSLTGVIDNTLPDIFPSVARTPTAIVAVGVRFLLSAIGALYLISVRKQYGCFSLLSKVIPQSESLCSQGLWKVLSDGGELEVVGGRHPMRGLVTTGT